jgi:hypothetical protein
MATYKGIGFDGTKTRTGTNADSVQFLPQVDAQNGISATKGVSSDTLSTTGDANIGGNLTVTGDIVSKGEVQLVVQDPMIDLGLGNTSTTAQAGGYSLSMNRNAGFTSETITACTAGDAVVPSAPQLTASAVSSFAIGDILCLTGSSDSGNDGLYCVAGVSGTTITLEGIGGSALSGATPFCQNQVATTTGDNAQAFKLDLYVQAVSDGSANFNDSTGTPFGKGVLVENFVANATKGAFTANGSYQAVGSSASVLTMQDTYDNGSSIITASSQDIAFDLSSGNFTLDNGNIELGKTNATNFAMDGGQFTVGATTPASFAGLKAQGTLFEGTASSTQGVVNLIVSDVSSSLTISMATDVMLEAKENGIDLFSNMANKGAGTIERTATGAGDDLRIQLKGNTASSLALESQASSSSAISIDTKLGGAGFGGGIYIASDAGIEINADELIDINGAGALQIDVANGYSIDATGASNVSVTNAQLQLQTLGATPADLLVDSTKDIALDATGVVKLAVGGAEKLSAGSTSVIASTKFQADSVGGFQFGVAGHNVSSILDEDNMASDSDTALATQQSIKAYVDAQVTAQDLDFSDGTNTSAVDLDSQTLSILGTASEIETLVAGQSVTIGLPNAVSIATSLNVGGSAFAVTGFIDDDTFGTASATTLPSSESVKAYVDAQITAQDLDFGGDTGTGAVDLDSQSLTIAGGTNINTNASGQTLSVALDDAVDLVTSLTIQSSTVVTSIKDEDNMASDSDTALATQQSIKAYVDTSITSATDPLQPYTELTKATLATISVGDVVAMDASGQAIQADASADATAHVIGLCTFVMGTTIYVQQIGNNKNVSGLTAGTKYYLSTTSGALTNTAPSASGEIVYQIGYARSATELVLAPQYIMEIG